MTAAGPHSHTPQSQFAARGGAGRLAFGRPALPWLGFSVSEFKLASGGARAPALQVWRGGACRWLGGAEATWRHLPTHRAQVAHVLQPYKCGEGGGAGGLEGPKPHDLEPPAPPAQAQVAHVLQPSRCGEGGGAGGLEGAEATWRHPSGHMATGGVWNLLQVLFALFCPWPQAA